MAPHTMWSLNAESGPLFVWYSEPYIDNPEMLEYQVGTVSSLIHLVGKGS